MQVRYAIFDPTGNITALVEDPVEESLQPAVARLIMDAHAEVEQVGFVGPSPVEGVDGALRMAGGEFCGNATMSAAAQLFLRDAVHGSREDADGNGVSVRLKVSGASGIVEVKIRPEGDGAFEGAVRMPDARLIVAVPLDWRGVTANVPIVFLEGISHAIVYEGSPFAPLAEKPVEAEAAVRAWCESLEVDGLGIMFLGHAGSTRTLTPLVFVPGADTCFWERSCASGTSACGMFEAARFGRPVDLVLAEPGGTLRVKSESLAPTWLYGHVREIAQHGLTLPDEFCT